MQASWFVGITKFIKRRMIKMKTKIVNRKNASFDISVGRDSKWGNPFRMLKQTIVSIPFRDL